MSFKKRKKSLLEHDFLLSETYQFHHVTSRRVEKTKCAGDEIGNIKTKY